jgi:hypothetical protein
MITFWLWAVPKAGSGAIPAQESRSRGRSREEISRFQRDTKALGALVVVVFGIL